MLCPVLVSFVLLRYVKSGLVRSRQSGLVPSSPVESCIVVSSPVTFGLVKLSLGSRVRSGWVVSGCVTLGQAWSRRAKAVKSSWVMFS